MKDNYEQQVELVCPSCGGKTFEYDDEDVNTDLTCQSCRKQFTKDELMNANEKQLNGSIEKMGKQLLKDTADDLKKSLE